jgi:hypothetical protein
MADAKKAFTWEEEDKREAANPSAAKSGFTWADVDAKGPSSETLDTLRERSAQPTQFERERSGNQPGQGFISHVRQSIRSMAPADVPSIGDMVKAGAKASLGPLPQMAETGVNAVKEGLAAHGRGHGLPYSTAAGLSSIAGASPERMEAAAARGDTGGVLGEAAVPTAMALAPEATRGIKAIGPAAGDMLRTEEGKLRPSVKTIASVGSGLAGLATGHPSLGLGGLFKGAEIADRIIPGRSLKPVYPGANLPDIGEHYENRGAELNKIRSMNDVLDRRTARDAKAAAKASPPESGPTDAPASSDASVLKIPIPRNLAPGERVGYNASTPRKLLVNNALQGRPGAGEMLRNIGRTPLYVGEEIGNGPKERVSLENIGRSTEPQQIPIPARRIGTANDRPQVQYKPSEKASTLKEPSKDYGPEFEDAQWSEEIRRNQDILRNPRATAEDRQIATERLRDAQERRPLREIRAVANIPELKQ